MSQNLFCFDQNNTRSTKVSQLAVTTTPPPQESKHGSAPDKKVKPYITLTYTISNVDDLIGRRLTLYTLHRDVNRGYTDRPVAKHTPIRPYITRTRHREVDQDSANVRLLLDWRCRRQMGPMKGHASHE